jgi:hypothetical protein
MESQTEIASVARHGLIGHWVALSTGLAEKAVRTYFAVVQDIRIEVHQRVGSSIDFVEGSQQAVNRIFRSMNNRIDALAKETVDTSESALIGVVRSAQTTSDEAAQFASRTVSSVLTRAQKHPAPGTN